jgi:hypothetical protein
VLKPGPVIHEIYNCYWFWGRHSPIDLWYDLRAVTRVIQPRLDVRTPGLREGQARDDAKQSSPHTLGGPRSRGSEIAAQERSLNKRGPLLRPTSLNSKLSHPRN